MLSFRSISRNEYFNLNVCGERMQDHRLGIPFHRLKEEGEGTEKLISYSIQFEEEPFIRRYCFVSRNFKILRLINSKNL